MPEPLIFSKEQGYYQIPLFASTGLRVLFTTRRFNMSFERGGRAQAYRALGLDGRRLVCSSQVHSDGIFLVEKKHRGRGAFSRATAVPDNDALITAAPGIPLGILTADCLAVVLWAPEERVAAFVHAGWRGTHKQIIAQTIGKMARRFRVSAAGVVAALGPSIRNCCYEVGREFLEYFPECVAERRGKIYFDIIAAAGRQMVASGVRPDRIYDSGICTCCAGSEFYSYRREGADTGRSMAIAEIIE